MAPTILIIVEIILNVGILVDILRRSTQRLSFVVFVIPVFILIFVVQPIAVSLGGVIGILVSEDEVIQGLLFAIVAEIAFVLGWKKFGQRTGGQCIRGPRDQYRERNVLEGAVILQLLSVVGYSIFIVQSGGIQRAFGTAHAAGAAWNESSAYIYNAPYLSATALALYLMSDGVKTRGLRKIGAVTSALSLLLYSVATASRGPMIVVIIMVVMASGWRSQVVFTVRRILGIMLALSISIMLLIGYRSVLHLGGSIAEADAGAAIRSLWSVNQDQLESRNSGLEFIFHCQLIRAVDSSGLYLFGADYLYSTTIHLLPRMVWPDKPLSPRRTSPIVDVMRADSTSTIAYGGACGLFADMFWNFGWFGALGMALLGRGVRAMHDKYVAGQSRMWAFIYVCVCGACSFIVAQDLNQGLIFCLYMVLPGVIVLKVNYRLRTGRRAATRRATEVDLC